MCGQLVHSSLIDWWWNNREPSQGLTNLQSLGSSRSGGYVCIHGHQVSNFQLAEILAPVKQLRKCILDTAIYLLQRRTKDSGTAIWLIYCLNCCQFSPYIRFCNYMFISFQSLILESGFCDSGQAWETVAFPLTRGQEKMSGKEWLHKVLLSYILLTFLFCFEGGGKIFKTPRLHLSIKKWQAGVGKASGILVQLNSKFIFTVG